MESRSIIASVLLPCSPCRRGASGPILQIEHGEQRFVDVLDPIVALLVVTLDQALAGGHLFCCDIGRSCLVFLAL